MELSIVVIVVIVSPGNLRWPPHLYAACPIYARWNIVLPRQIESNKKGQFTAR
jgi:hypothetical protein